MTMLRYRLELAPSGRLEEVQVRAYAGGELGIHPAIGTRPAGNLWTISHRRSGRALVLGLQGEECARAVAAVLARLPIDWGATTESNKGVVQAAMGDKLWLWFYQLQRDGFQRDRGAASDKPPRRSK